MSRKLSPSRRARQAEAAGEATDGAPKDTANGALLEGFDELSEDALCFKDWIYHFEALFAQIELAGEGQLLVQPLTVRSGAAFPAWPADMQPFKVNMNETFTHMRDLVTLGGGRDSNPCSVLARCSSC